MSDIPVGSPPVPPGRHAAPGGWYPDPLDQAQERYWDGWQWSRNTRPREGAIPRQAPPVGQQTQPYPGPPTYGAVPGPQGYGAPWGGAVPPGKPPVLTADGVPVASWWWRVLAVLLDGTFTGVVTTLLTLPFLQPAIRAFATWYADLLQATQRGTATPPPPDIAALLTASDTALITTIVIGVRLIYQLAFLRRTSATPGKLICGLRVVPVDQGRWPGPLSWRSILIRTLIWVLPGAYSPLFIVTVADALTPLGHPKRQALHDIPARTQVVRRAG